MGWRDFQKNVSTEGFSQHNLKKKI
jgi:hypothetical protein